MSRKVAHARRPRPAATDSSALPACQQELALLRDSPACATAARPVAGRSAGNGPSGAFDAEAEFEEAHDLFDALMAGRRDEPLADRLRGLLVAAAGDRVARIVNPEVGKALSRYHLDHSGHPQDCPCNPCRDARRLR